MSEPSTALESAAHKPSREIDVPTLRRRGVMRRRKRVAGAFLASTTVVVALAALVLTLAPGDTSRVLTETSQSWQTYNAAFGTSIDYPSDWQVAQQSLTPRLSDPREVVALGTFAMQPTTTDRSCDQLPVNTAEDMSASDALVWVTERVGTDQIPAWDFGPRPASLDLSSGDDITHGDLSACASRQLDATVRRVEFDDLGRHFSIVFAYGSDTSSERRDDLVRVMNSFRVTQ